MIDKCALMVYNRHSGRAFEDNVNLICEILFRGIKCQE